MVDHQVCHPIDLGLRQQFHHVRHDSYGPRIHIYGNHGVHLRVVLVEGGACKQMGGATERKWAGRRRSNGKACCLRQYFHYVQGLWAMNGGEGVKSRRV